jgi:predicted ATPase
VLLVLDNCEHLLDGVAHVVTALNSACPGVSILATSREHLRVQGEKTYTASPLTYPTTSAELTTAARYPAVQLFMTRASLLTDFELNPGNLTAVCDIVRSLDGLPLAIELVVPSLRVLNIQDLASRLRSRLALHQHGPRGAPLRHQSLRGLIDWSYERLPDDERFVFRCCSVFAGYFTIEAVSAVCSRGGMHEDDVLRSFSALVDKSLVFVNGDDERRYALLEIIKEYAARALGESGAQEAALRDHASFYLETARRMMDSRTTASLRVRVEQLKTDTSNFQAALSWCLSCKRDPELGAALALALYQLFEYESDSRSGHWFERALELLDPESAPELWAGLVVKRELPSHVLRQMPEQIRNLERAVAYYRDNADANQYCEALGCLCNALTAVGDRAGAKHTAAAAVRVARELNVPKRLCWALRLSAVALGHDEPQQQIAYLTECLRVYDNSFADEAVVFNLGLLGEAEFFAGLPRAALEHTRKALDVLRTMPTLLGIVRAMCLGNAAVYHLALDEFDEARAAAQRALQLSRDADDPMFSAFVIQHLAFISAKIGNLSRAALLLGFSNARTMSVNEAKVRVEIACRRRLLTFLADKLDAVELAALLADGALWSEERAVTEALNV